MRVRGVILAAALAALPAAAFAQAQAANCPASSLAGPPPVGTLAAAAAQAEASRRQAARCFGETSLPYAQALIAVADVRAAQAAYADAEGLYRQALALRRQALPAVDPAVAVARLRVAAMADRLGRYAEAEAEVRAVMADHPAAPGREDALQAEMVGSLGWTLYQQGRLDDAEPLLTRAVTIADRALGFDHPTTQAYAHRLVRLYERKYLIAGRPLLDVLAVQAVRATPPADLTATPATASRLLAYGREVSFNEKAAEPALRKALAIRLDVFDPDHPETAEVQEELARLLLDLDRLGEAERLAASAVAARERSLGSKHPDYAAALETLGRVLWAQGRGDEAEGLLRRAVAIRAAALSPSHPDRVRGEGQLAIWLDEMGRKPEAEAAWQAVGPGLAAKPRLETLPLLFAAMDHEITAGRCQEIADAAPALLKSTTQLFGGFGAAPQLSLVYARSLACAHRDKAAGEAFQSATVQLGGTLGSLNPAVMRGYTQWAEMLGDDLGADRAAAIARRRRDTLGLRALGSAAADPANRAFAAELDSRWRRY